MFKLLFSPFVCPIIQHTRPVPWVSLRFWFLFLYACWVSLYTCNSWLHEIFYYSLGWMSWSVGIRSSYEGPIARAVSFIELYFLILLIKCWDNVCRWQSKSTPRGSEETRVAMHQTTHSSVSCSVSLALYPFLCNACKKITSILFPGIGFMLVEIMAPLIVVLFILHPVSTRSLVSLFCCTVTDIPFLWRCELWSGLLLEFSFRCCTTLLTLLLISSKNSWVRAHLCRSFIFFLPFFIFSFPPSTGPVNASHGSSCLLFPYSFALSSEMCCFRVSLKLYYVFCI